MKFRRALVVAAGALALVVPTTPAFAALYTHEDASGDVYAETCTDPEDESTCTEGVDHAITEGDITRVNIRHQSRRVLIRIKQRELSRHGLRGHFIRIVTNEGRENFVQAVSLDGSTMPDFVVLTRRDGETPIKCSGLWVGYDVATEMVTVIVPRSCLSRPRWVRVGVGAFSGNDDFTTFGADDFLKNGGVGDTVALSPRIRRG